MLSFSDQSQIFVVLERIKGKNKTVAPDGYGSALSSRLSKLI